MGSPCLFTAGKQALKMGYFHWLRVKNSNHLHIELSLDYCKETKFYLERKAYFIHMSSITSFKPFLIAWLREYCTFLHSFVVSLKYSQLPGQNTPSLELFCQKVMFYYQTFFLLQICSLLDCS